MKRKLLSILMAAALTCSMGAGILPPVQSAQAAGVQNESVSAAQPFVEMTGDELMEDMGAGWNLGNTMDGHTGFTPGETIWQDVKTTKRLIKEVHDLGFHTVRIPVTWGTMIDDENDYAIDEAWLSRVQDIVDYCISQDMYAIVNIHHDGAEQTGWLRIAADDQKALEEKFAGVWKNIAAAFKDYDEHLILESMNEVRGTGMTVLEENQVIMKLNQIFVNTVRGTGSNNAKRWLMVPGKYNYIDSICNEKNGFKLPEDTVENRIILSVHVYTPWSFCGSETLAANTYSVKELASNDNELKPLYEKYTSKGIPVVVGEYGCINKDNASERAFYLEGMNRMFQKYKLVGVYWDQGWYDRSQKPDYSFTIIDRSTGKPIDKEITDGIMRGYFGSTDDYTTLTKNVEVIPMTSLQVSGKTVDLAVNESKKVEVSCAPDNTNDIVLWKTDDPAIATVAYGKIQAKGIGSTKVTAFSQSGSVSCELTVNVTAENAAVPCTGLEVGTREYSLSIGDTEFLSPVLSPAETTETLYYQSSDESVVTVSSIGKLVATGSGEAVVTVCTTGGKQETVKVTVAKAEMTKEVRLAVNVYYNDSSKNYFANEISNQIISVNQNGQYELSFDCDTDLSSAAKAAGVSNLNKVTAIYIKDYDVSIGKLSKTSLTSCQIRYDKITVDGVELTLTNSEYKSALKASGIFDTNDPVNSWDGSAVEEVNVSNYVASFSTITDPKKITIQFTLNDMCFEGSEPEPTLPPDEPLTPAEPTKAPSDTETPAPSDTSVKVGSKVTKSNGVYKVTAAGGVNRAVLFTGPVKKTLTEISIPASVKIEGKSYKVTSIAKNAFKNNKKLSRVTIGSNVASIGKNAFSGCGKLKSITIKTIRLTGKKVGSKAFKGIHSKAVIKVPKSRQRAYKKLLKVKGIGAKVTVKS